MLCRLHLGPPIHLLLPCTSTNQDSTQGSKIEKLMPLSKGQLISKADWRTINSPKKRTDEFVLFAFLLFTANKSNLSIHCLGESTGRQSVF